MYICVWTHKSICVWCVSMEFKLRLKIWTNDVSFYSNVVGIALTEVRINRNVLRTLLPVLERQGGEKKKAKQKKKQRSGWLGRRDLWDFFPWFWRINQSDAGCARISACTLVWLSLALQSQLPVCSSAKPTSWNQTARWEAFGFHSHQRHRAAEPLW